MANDRVELHRVTSCNLGRLGPDDVALKINFAMPTGEGKASLDQTAVFGLTHELAHGLAEALIRVLEEMATTRPASSAQN